MVTGIGATMPSGGITVGASPPPQHMPQEAGQPPVVQSTTGGPVTSPTNNTRRSSENRRSNKPIMEKRRRARINNCLNELKTLLLDAKKKDPARHSKLEKADILEMTVKHLENLQRQQVALAAATDTTVVNKFRAGFTECASEVGKFPGLDAGMKRRLMTHLANCITTVDSNINPQNNNNAGIIRPQPQMQTPQQTATTQLQVHILPQVDSTTNPQRIQVQQSTNGMLITNANLQLVPTRLPNGHIALVLPTSATTTTATTKTTNSPAASPAISPAPSSPLPTLIPIPQRTASTASASSSTSVSSTSTSAASPVAFEAPPANYASHRDQATSPTNNGYTSDPEFDPRIYSPPLQRPLSLVMRKSVVEEKPWRPW